MSEPLGYLLTWHTYGTWLHGDPRGSVDRRHNGYETPGLDPCGARREFERGRMPHPPVKLATAAREVVADVLRRHCGIRQWELHDCAVRSNHVHVVVAHAGVEPDMMVGQFKACGTRALRAGGHVAPRAVVWAEGASTRYLWKREHVNAACAYVRDGQDVRR